MNPEILKALREAESKCTPDWRAGRSDMQSYTGDGWPYKALYCDSIESEMKKEASLDEEGHGPFPLEAGRIYGPNSINDTQFFVLSRNHMKELLDEVERVGQSLESTAAQSMRLLKENQRLRELLGKARHEINCLLKNSVLDSPAVQEIDESGLLK